jgi:hypothetical protein
VTLGPGETLPLLEGKDRDVVAKEYPESVAGFSAEVIGTRLAEVKTAASIHPHHILGAALPQARRRHPLRHLPDCPAGRCRLAHLGAWSIDSGGGGGDGRPASWHRCRGPRCAQIFFAVVSGSFVLLELRVRVRSRLNRHGSRSERGSLLVVYASVCTGVLGGFTKAGAVVHGSGARLAVPNFVGGLVLMGAGIAIQQWAVALLVSTARSTSVAPWSGCR